MALFDICKVMGFFSVQEYFEKEHYDKIFQYKGTSWWDERAKIFGYTAKQLKSALKELGVKYQSQRQALMRLDKYELIRIGVTEMFIVMGKSHAYAKNVGNIAKDIAMQIKPEIYNDKDISIDFKSDEQNLIITDLKKEHGSSLLQKFARVQRSQHINQSYNQLNLSLNGGNDVSGNSDLDSAFDKAMKKKLPDKGN